MISKKKQNAKIFLKLNSIVLNVVKNFLGVRGIRMFENRRTIVKLFLDAGSIVVAVFFAFIARYEDV